MDFRPWLRLRRCQTRARPGCGKVRDVPHDSPSLGILLYEARTQVWAAVVGVPLLLAVSFVIAYNVVVQRQEMGWYISATFASVASGMLFWVMSMVNHRVRLHEHGIVVRNWVRKHRVIAYRDDSSVDRYVSDRVPLSIHLKSGRWVSISQVVGDIDRIEEIIAERRAAAN